MAVLQDAPQAAGAWFLLGLIAAEHENVARAAELFARAEALDPADPRAPAQRARCMIALNRRDEALAHAGRAQDLDPRDAHTLDTLGVVYARAGLHARAIPLFKAATLRDPANAGLAYNLGSALQFAGDFSGAEAAYGAALALDPGLYRAWSSRISLRRQTEADHHLAELEALFAATDDADARLHLGHALAKTCEDLGRWPMALDWLGRAKAAKRAAVGYDRAVDAAIFAAAAEGARAGGTSGAASDRPIFVVGLPRTGTTLVDRILSSHPDVVSVGELTNFALLVKRATSSPGAYVLDPATLRAAERVDVRALGEAYLSSVTPLAGASGRFVDKMPLNIIYAGLIHRALPQARIICLRRHPLDACLSNYRQLFATAFSYYDYALDLADTAAYFAGFQRLADHWRATLPPERYAEVAYEDLVHDQEGQTRRLLDFCDLEFDVRCLAFHENAAPVATASSVQVRSPIYSSAIGRWRRYGAALGSLISALQAEGVDIGTA